MFGIDSVDIDSDIANRLTVTLNGVQSFSRDPDKRSLGPGKGEDPAAALEVADCGVEAIIGGGVVVDLAKGSFEGRVQAMQDLSWLQAALVLHDGA